MAETFSAKLDEFTDSCFPLKTRTIKSTDKAWITPHIKRAIRRKKREYARSRKSRRWKELEGNAENKIKEAKQNYLNKVKKEMLKTNNKRKYFQTVKLLGQPDTKAAEEWTIGSMFPGKSDAEIADTVAEYFNRISREYTPLRTDDCESGIATQDCPAVHEVAARLKKIRKPRSRVSGDIFPSLVSELADPLAIPIQTIFRKAYQEGRWPRIWRSETVTVIPKTGNPTELG